MIEPEYRDEQRFWDARGAQDYVSLSEFDQARIERWIGWSGNGRVLDIGGGSGMVSRLLERQPGTTTVCVDISHAMLRHAPGLAVQTNALRLPFRAASFDLIVAAAFFHHLPGREAQLLTECRRVLAGGGKVIGYDPSAECLQNRLFMSSGPLRLSSFSPDERPIAIEQLRAIAARAGFSTFTYRRFSFRNARLTPFEAVQRFVLSPLARGPLQRWLERWVYWSASG